MRQQLDAWVYETSMKYIDLQKADSGPTNYVGPMKTSNQYRVPYGSTASLCGVLVFTFMDECY